MGKKLSARPRMSVFAGGRSFCILVDICPNNIIIFWRIDQVLPVSRCPSISCRRSMKLQLVIGQKNDMSQMVEFMKTIVSSTPAAAAVTTPTVTPPTAFADYSAKIMILLEEKKRYKDMGECVMSLDVKIQKLNAKRDELDEL